MTRRARSLWVIAATSLGLALVAIALLGLALAPDQNPGIQLTDAGPISVSSTNATALNGAHPGVVTTRPQARNDRASRESRVPRPPSTTVVPVPPKPADFAPVAVRVPSVGISSPLVRLGLNPDHTLQVPDDYRVAGWYIYRPVPGERGPGVLAGHIDSKKGPGVFYHLKDAPLGATIEVERNDGSVAQFVVTAKEQHNKDAFPTEHVYGPTKDAELRLITCGGTFNRATGHYTDNIIVFAKLSKIVPVAARVMRPTADDNTPVMATTHAATKSSAIVVAHASHRPANATMLPADKTKLARAASPQGPWSGPATTYPIAKPRSSTSLPNGAAAVARPLAPVAPPPPRSSTTSSVAAP
jgi:sortase (surface protein transpeptidase)